MRLSARAAAQAVAATTFAALLVTAALLPVPYVRLSPGPTINVLDEDRDPPLIQITGTATFPTDGRLDLTTVSELGGPRSNVSLIEAFFGWVAADVAVVPESLLYPDDVTGAEVEEADQQAMELSQESAIAAAVNYLDIDADTVVVVQEVSADSPADGVLEPGDEILAVDDREVTDPAQVRDIVRERSPGEAVELTIRRDGEQQSVTITTGESSVDAGEPFIGIVPGVVVDPPFEVDISLDEVGGPSAGLVFALGIVDRLTPEQETGGRFVAGTGTVSADGMVGPIGGLPQKLAAARDAGAAVFLVPGDNCADAAGVDVGDMRLLRVDTLATAVEALAALDATGAEPVGCG